MAKRIFYTANQSWTATAVNTVMAANATFMGMQGGNATQICDMLEFLISGNASASTVGGFVFAPASVVGATLSIAGTGASDGPMNTSATALGTAFVSYNTATTRPTTYTAATVPVVNLGLNLFGGIIRWNAAPTQQVTSIGNVANTGSWVLFNSSTSGGITGSANAHIIYEPY